MGVAAAAALLAVTLAYQVALPVTVDMGRGFVAARLTRDLHEPEGGFRWTRERSHVLLPGPGPFRRVTVEATVSAWRPRGQPPPLLALEVESAQARAMATMAPRPQVVALAGTTRGLWPATLDLALSSDAVQPSRNDPRRLGVRVHQVRLTTPSPWSPGLPPLLPLLLAVLVAAAVSGAGLRLGRGARTARAAGLAAALALGLALALFRAPAVVLLPPLAVLALVALVAAPAAPALARGARATVSEALRRLRAGAAVLGPAPALAIGVAAIAAVWIATAARPSLDLPLGTGREEPYGRGLLAYDAEGAVAFRHAAPDAALDLRDLGAGRWSLDARDPAGASLPLALDPADGVARFGWRPGVVVRFAGGGDALRLARVHVERGRALPSPRVALAVAVAALLLGLAVATVGCRRATAIAAALVLALAAGLALAADPVLATPLAVPFAAACAAALALAALAAGLDAGRGALPPAALAACVVGFLAWLQAPLTPLYRGGHFVFHSSIAEEIWQGRLLLYVLPYPGSMLSQQAQWGNVVVPHPCLFHVVVAPFAALPRPWFYVAVKACLALWFAGMAAAAALLARRLAGPRAATYAAVALAATPATFQLIGLGHLMTIFGCWAMTMAVAWVALRFERLRERAPWWTAMGLLTLCFLSYTAALLFTGVAFALALPWLLKRDRPAAWALASATAAAGAAAFFIYYVYWAWPFLSVSVPRLLGGAGAATAGVPAAASAAGGHALWPRLAALPHKLAYTFGTALAPLLGLAGLGLAAGAGGAAAVLLLAWGLVFVLFCGADLFFNFLLKHHYFAILPVAVGLGVLLERVGRRPGGRWLVGVLLIGWAALALKIALAVATGGIP